MHSKPFAVVQTPAPLLGDIRELILKARRSLATAFPEMKIVQSLIAQLGWTQFLHIIRRANPLKDHD